MTHLRLAHLSEERLKHKNVKEVFDTDRRVAKVEDDSAERWY